MDLTCNTHAEKFVFSLWMTFLFWNPKVYIFVVSGDSEVIYLWQQDNPPVTRTELAFQGTELYYTSIVGQTLNLFPVII